MKKALNIAKYGVFVLFNIFFWIAVYFFYNFFLGYGSSNTEYVNRFSVNLMPITILLSYFVILVLIPKYLLKRKYGLFALYSVYTFVVSFGGIMISIFHGLIFSSYVKEVNSKALTKSLLLIILGVYFVVIIATVIGFVVHSYLSGQKNQELKNKILETELRLKQQELKFLKMQIHPHFLFNSLNTIYGYALTKQEEAPEMILKLSNLLDYILYQIEKPSVLLENELNHIDDYVALEKIRFHDSLKVTIQKEGDLKGVSIAPMLLIPFVENSFKHGTLVDGVLDISMRILLEEKILSFEISNSAKKNEEPEQGIGLGNIQKRLDLLYKAKYNLEINHQNDRFTVKLNIDLHSSKET